MIKISKVAIIGANGKVARHLLHNLIAASEDILNLTDADLAKFTVTRQDVASVILEVLKDTSGKSSRKVYSLVNGDEVGVEEVLADAN